MCPSLTTKQSVQGRGRAPAVSLGREVLGRAAAPSLARFTNSSVDRDGKADCPYESTIEPLSANDDLCRQAALCGLVLLQQKVNGPLWGLALADFWSTPPARWPIECP